MPPWKAGKGIRKETFDLSFESRCGVHQTKGTLWKGKGRDSSWQMDRKNQNQVGGVLKPADVMPI